MSIFFRTFILSLLFLFPLSSHASQALPVAAPPSVEARGYLVMDFHSGAVLAEREADSRMEPASITKIMTAYVIYRELKNGSIGLEDEVRISEKAWRMGGSRMFVEVNTRVKLKDLLKGMIVQSGNDATVALAEHVAGSEEAFVSLMNQQAKALGMNDTHYTNSTGWPDPELYTTARDIARLAHALIRDFPEEYRWYSEREFTYNGIRQHNRNLMLWRDESVDGVKTGHTESAGFCLVTSAKRDDMRLITVVLGTASEKDRADQTQTLLNWGFRFFETHRLYTAGQPLTETRVWKGETDKVALGLTRDLYVTIPRGRYQALKATLELSPKLEAPLQKGAVQGEVNVTLDGAVIRKESLIALQAVEEGGILRRAMDTVMQWFD
ncbi:MAG: D-alanyl-D-alanine carboxypeptidase [Chromatiales bacterium]|jgi:D-alanyl-D-alanine carboxypeptidase (penicillin-binding protein 5/6)|nr:D-alanyl-D-alanine carboxypeptidase [Chromatiales bacterium]MDX9767981.1 D-alanyl-D-alanine carboxypeptidase family protein [Ectothiorhodospiraceae bacterium]